VDPDRRHPDFAPIAGTTERSVQVLGVTVRIHLTVERPAVAAYLDSIPPDKREVALVHALEIGVAEVLARRARPKK
jgi:hypothetical protein